MSKLTLQEISGIMKHIDICMMTTLTASGHLDARPMSNNRDVEYTGDSYFFSLDDTSAVKELAVNSEVSLAFIGHHSFINRKSVYIAVEAKATLIKDKAAFREHWVKDLEMWFKEGVDTPGLTLIHAKAHRIKYWDGWEEGEIRL